MTLCLSKFIKIEQKYSALYMKTPSTYYIADNAL